MSNKEQEKILATEKANASLFDLFYRTQENIQFNPAKQDELSTTLNEMNKTYGEELLIKWLQKHSKGELLGSNLNQESLSPEHSGVLDKLLNLLFSSKEVIDTTKKTNAMPFYYHEKGQYLRGKDEQP